MKYLYKERLMYDIDWILGKVHKVQTHRTTGWGSSHDLEGGGQVSERFHSRTL